MRVQRQPWPVSPTPTDGSGASTSTPPPSGQTVGDHYEASTPHKTRHIRHIEPRTLAASPSDALDAWPRLRPAERGKVLDEMRARYGADFTKSFEVFAQHPEKRSDLTRTYGPGVGPSEETLVRQGFKPYARAYYNEIWVHPSGQVVMKVLDRNGPPTAASPKASSLDPRAVEAKDTVEGMRAWLDELSALNPKSPEYGPAYTDFWSLLTQQRDELKEALKDPDLDGPSKKALEKSLEAVEALNQERAARLPADIVAPSGQDAIVFNDWLYLSDK